MGYFAGDKLKIIRVNGGSPVDLSPVGNTAGAVAPSGTWSSGDQIVFGPMGGALHRIGAKGGAPTPVTKAMPQDTAHRWPSFLADGRRFVYLALKGQAGELRVGSLNSTESVTLGPSESHASYAMGHLFFVRGGNLMAQAFDAGSTQLTGSPQFLGSQAGVDPPWQRGMFSVSGTGPLVYRPIARMRSQLTWLDRHSRAVGTLGDPGVFFNLDLSPDGQRVAVSQLTQRPGADAQFDIWVIDVSTSRTTRLTGDQGWDFDPAWSPDGTHIAFNSNQPNPGTGPFALFMRPADGGGNDVRLVEGEAGTGVVSPDWPLRDEIIYTKNNDLWRLPLTGNRTPIAVMKTAYAEGAAVVSPQGGWIAYQSDETGRMEVYVRPFPGPDPVRPISRDGGTMPRWRRDGSELYFLSTNQTLMTAAIDTRPAFTAGVPQPLFETALGLDNYRSYAVSPDGQRFLLPVFVPADARDPLRLVMDWRAMLGR